MADASSRGVESELRTTLLGLLWQQVWQVDLAVPRNAETGIENVRRAYFQDPTERTWNALKWRLADGIDAPFSADAADCTRCVSVREQFHVDP
ncbi:MAG: hypothetical protein CSB46_10450 [Micrococcales bacterium]|nr:MAG: hypothetical protein CSB46_10450 [Micrococcales bacterium]